MTRIIHPKKMKKTTILLVDDHAFMRMGIRTLVDFQPDMRIIGEADDGDTAVRLAHELQPDVVVMDLMMPNMDGAEATKRILEAAPRSRIVILSSFGPSAEMARALSFGASGAVLKESPTENLLTAIRTVSTGGKAIDRQVAHSVRDIQLPKFTERQEAVLYSITRGLSNDDIATQLGISKPRVKQHLNEIYEKLGAANRAEAVAIALRKHLLKI